MLLCQENLQKLHISSTVEVIMQTDVKYLHALASIPSVTGKTLRILAAYFSSFEEAWRADEGLIRETDSDYPLLLAQIPNPPFILYGTGRATLFESQIPLGVVGSRKPTSYGIQATETITETLARAGACIISGLALGIDAIAHRTAVEAGGATIAVLGSGIDNESLYPPSNQGLARRITESGGAVISEYPPGTPALKEHFPARNRIISGLSKGILVVEAQEKSGALITARFALEQNRDVFAVPGSIFSLSSKGTNALIQEGAKLVSCGEDILKEYGIEYTTNTGSLEPL
ncbi:MAG: protecting protein DprA protein, partial [Parcubacteria group bacterium GW2011_GWB1_50_9]